MFVYFRIKEIFALTGGTDTLYTQPANKTTYIRMIHIHNANTTIETVKLWKIPDGSSAGDTTEIYREDIEAYGTRVIEYPIPGLILIDSGETIKGITTTASKVTVEITGGQE